MVCLGQSEQPMTYDKAILLIDDVPKQKIWLESIGKNQKWGSTKRTNPSCPAMLIFWNIRILNIHEKLSKSHKQQYCTCEPKNRFVIDSIIGLLINLI